MFLFKGGKKKRIFFQKQLVLIITLILGISTLGGIPPVGANGPEPVSINEIMYNPDGSDSGREWIELYNDADYDIDISGWKFYESNTNHGLTLIQGSKDLAGKGYGVICSDPTKFLTDYPSYTGTLYDSSFSLSNSGEYLAIKNDTLIITDDVTYVPMAGADDTGMSLEYDGMGCWYPSLIYGGTPGAPNSKIIPMEVTKTVWDGNAWVDMVTASLADSVTFNITITNLGTDSYILYNLLIVDTLPQNLAFTGNATLNGQSRPPDNLSGSEIIWDIPVTEFFIDPGISAFIEFTVEVIGSGTSINHVNVTSEYCDPDILYVYGEDTATVDVVITQEVAVEKQVKGTGTGFGEEITVPQYSTVTFNLSIESIGPNIMDLKVTDELPPGLSYVINSATINGVSQEPTIVGNTLTWLVADIPGDSTVIILFDALVNQLGTHLNFVNVSLYNQQLNVSAEDTALVKCSNLVFNKQIWCPATQSWEETGTAAINDTVRFNLSLGYYGPSVIVYINISDNLPSDMTYAGNASTPETGYIPTSNTIWWHIIALLPGMVTYIEFDAQVLQTGTLINHGIASATECGNPIPLTGFDNLTVQVGTMLTCDAGGPYSGNVSEQIPITGSASGGNPPYDFFWDLDNDGQYNDDTGMHINVSWSNPGTYTIGLKVIDSWMLTATDSTTVTISQQGMTADAGGPYTGIINETINITGTVTGGVSPYNFSWDLDNDGQYDDGSGPDTSYSWSEPGNYIINLRVIDAETTEAYDTANVQINSDELQADAGGPYQGMVNISVPLHGSATGGHPPYNFSWDLDNDGEYDDATGKHTNNTWNKTGEYTIALKVIDSTANESTDTTTVTITSEDLIADAGGPYGGSVNTYIALNGTAFGGVPPYLFEWDLNNDSVYEEEGANITHLWDTYGEYPISLKVTDDVGNHAIDNTTVTICGASVSITKPLPNYIYLWNVPLPLPLFSLIIGPFTITVQVDSDVACNLSLIMNGEELYTENGMMGSHQRQVKHTNMCLGMRMICATVTDAYGTTQEHAVSVLVFSMGRLLRP